jgi:DNA mismatch repair protein MutS2
VYVEPTAVVEVHNDLREAEAALEHEVRRILGDLSRRVGARRRPLAASLAAATEIDVACARASLGRKLDGAIPTVQADGVLVAPGARHPLLVLQGAAVIPNDLTLSPRAPALVLTGPNAGGKTIALKTLGLLALCVRAAIPVPCGAAARVDLFDPVLADIGDLQSVADGLSTFSAHVKGLGEALAEARPGAMVLVDEITAGTDPAQGAALARAVIEALVDAGARVAVTTHFPELKALSAADPRFAVAAAEFRDGRPTFHIQAGVPGPSHAFAIARRMGLPEHVLDRAGELVDVNIRELSAAVEKLEAERSRVATLEAGLRDREADLHRRDAALRHQEERLRTQAQREQERLTEAHRARLKAQEEEVRALVAALQANPDLKSANAALQTIRAGRVPDTAAPSPEAPPFRPEVGDQVRVTALGQVGRVRTVASDGRAEVEIGRLRSWLQPDAIEPLGGSEARRERRKERRAEPPPEPPRPRGRGDDPMRGVGVPVERNTCDLRGMRVDEATLASEQFFDQRSLEGVHTVFVLHGHGTGALKSALREWLPRCRYVRGWRPADSDEGGDAYTLVELR